MVKKFVKLWLKLLNYSIGLGGIAITIYGILLIRAWQPDDYHQDPPQHFHFPWVFRAFLGVGVALCAITSLGHIAASTANAYCLSCYITIILLLLVSETAITAYVFMNPKWEKEFPSEKFDDFRDFLESYDEICVWFAMIIILVQGVCILLATILRTQNVDEADNFDHEDEDEHLQPNTPLLGRLGRWAVADSNIV